MKHSRTSGTRGASARSVLALTLAAATLVVVACGPDNPTSSSPPRAFAAATIPFAGLRPTLDDEYSELASTTPGFGGMYKEPGSDRFVAYLTDLSRSASARSAIDAFLVRKGTGLGTEVTFVQGAYDFRDLATWRRKIDQFDRSILTMTDVDESKNRVVVGVTDELGRRRLSSGLETLGIPAGAVTIDVVEAAVRENLQGLARPVRGGLQVAAVPSIGGGGLCTLGFVAIREFPIGGPESNGPRYVTTASHCTSAMGYNAGNVIGQPTQANPIGVEFSDPDFYGSSYDAACPYATPVCRRSDIALFKLDDSTSTVSTFNGVATASGLTLTGTAFYAGKQQGFATNQNVRMIGRTSGQTSGVITNTCVNVPVGGQTMLCQFYATYGSGDGDSGAPVWFYNASGIWVLGSHWGRIASLNRAIFSMWMDAQQELTNDILSKTGTLWLPSFTTGPANFTTS